MKTATSPVPNSGSTAASQTASPSGAGPSSSRLQVLIRRRIMLVVDEPMSRALIEAILAGEPDFETLMSDNALEMTRAVSGIDLVVLDVAMPPGDLYSLCTQIKGNPRAQGVPLLMLTPHSGASSVDRGRALEAGADDVLGKPFHRTELILRIRGLLRVKALRDELDETEQILFALCRAVDAKAVYTQAHSERVAVYAEMIGRDAGVPRDELRILRRAALLHDIGKLAIPELILNKPGVLTSEETKLMRQQLLLPVQIPSALTVATPQIIPIIRHHHEHIDGSGYPDHLVGEQIPLGARILAIADAFDAMTSQRPYRPAYSHEKAKSQLRAGGGSQWDKNLVDMFLNSLGSLKEVFAAASN